MPRAFGSRVDCAHRRDLAQYPARVSIKNVHTGWNTMNRRKKIQQLLKAHAKKASAKLAPAKDKYISKADRLKLAAAVSDEPSAVTDDAGAEPTSA